MQTFPEPKRRKLDTFDVTQYKPSFYMTLWGNLSKNVDMIDWQNRNLTLSDLEYLAYYLYIKDLHPAESYLINYNPNITYEFIRKTTHIFDWTFYLLCVHKNLTLPHLQDLHGVLKELDKDAIMAILNRAGDNPNITLDMIETYAKKINWRNFYRNPYLTVEFCTRYQAEYRGQGHFYKAMSHLKNLTMQDILRAPDQPWAWHLVSQHPNITMEDIEAHPELPWNYKTLPSNPNLTHDFILRHPDHVWYEAVMNANIDPDVMMQYPHIYFPPPSPDGRFNFQRLSNNPRISMKFIRAHPRDIYSTEALTTNPGINPHTYMNSNDILDWDSRIWANPNMMPDLWIPNLPTMSLREIYSLLHGNFALYTHVLRMQVVKELGEEKQKTNVLAPDLVRELDKYLHPL